MDDPKVKVWQVELRDPYCGAWVPIFIHITQSTTGEILSIRVINSEQHTVEAQPTDV